MNSPVSVTFAGHEFPPETEVVDLAPLADLPALRRVVLQRLAVPDQDIARLARSRPELDVVT